MSRNQKFSSFREEFFAHETLLALSKKMQFVKKNLSLVSVNQFVETFDLNTTVFPG